MAGPDDIDREEDLNAAERALGSEPRAREDAAGRRARRDWDAMLAPLALAAPPAEPPADMFQRIERGLDGEAETAAIIRLAERRARRWRAVAVAAGAVAACLAVWIAVAPTGPFAPPVAPQQSYVALVTPEGGGGPAMIVEVDTQKGVATVRTLRVAAPQGRALELWQVPAGGTPKSLGLIDLGSPMNAINASLEPGDTLAVSVEPPGGSPTGAPTGPVILSGPLIQTR